MKNQFEVFEEWMALCPVNDEMDIEAWDEEDNDQFYMRQWIFSFIPKNKIKEFEEWMKSCPYSTSNFTKDEMPYGYDISCFFKVPNDGSFPDDDDDDDDDDDY